MTPSRSAPELHIRFGTRGSALALAQTNLVVDRVRATYPQIRPEIRVVQTEGDLNRTAPLTEIGGRGVFTNAIEHQLLLGEVDAAVHSAKDLPSSLHPGVPIVAFPDRDDPRDVLVSRHETTLGYLPRNPVIGTSSRRREVQIRRLRPDARVVSIRGNIDTRLRKAAGTEFDAIVLAAAGICRMGWEGRVSEYFAVERLVPSPGQGAVAIQARAGSEAAALLAALDDPRISTPVRIERAFLAAIGAGCVTPVGAYASVSERGYRLVAMLADQSGARIAFADESLAPDEELAHAAEIARRLQTEVGGEVRLRTGAGWSGDAADVAGARVIVTRPRRQADELMGALAARGAIPLPLPTIRIEPVGDASALDDAIQAAARGAFDWIAFTSANAVDALAGRLADLGIDPASLGGLKVAAIGQATAAAARAAGFDVAFIPRSATGEVLATGLRDLLPRGARVLYPRSSIGRDALPQLLCAVGIEITAVDAYHTVPETEIDPDILAQLRRGEVDAITFSSPSSVRSLLPLLGNDTDVIASVPAICAGPVTSGAAREAGLQVVAESADPSPKAMVDAVARFWRDQQAQTSTNSKQDPRIMFVGSGTKGRGD